jgi:hypothetical protein
MSRTIIAVVCALALFAGAGRLAAQSGALRIVVLEGEDAVNLIDKKTAVKPTVEVRDRNDLPAAGALVIFAVRGRGATFANGARQISVTTDTIGRATVNELTPITRGTIEIQVNATYQGQTATATIRQTNFVNAAQAAQAGKPAQTGQSTTASSGTSTATTATTTTAGGAAGGGLSGLAIAGIIGGAAVGTAVGVAAATRDSSAPNTPPTVSGASATPNVALLGADTPIAFSVTATDPENNALTYAWDFGDGTSGSGATPTHVYRTAGQFTPRVTVSDGKDSTSAQTTVNIRTVAGRWTLAGFPAQDFIQVTQNAATITGVFHIALFAIGNNTQPVTETDCPLTGAVAANSPRVTFEQSGCQFPVYQCSPTQTCGGFDPGETLRLDPDAAINALAGQWIDHNGPEGSGPVTLTRQQ